MKTQKQQTMQIGTLEITTSESGSVSFKNEKNSFWCSASEIEHEVKHSNCRCYDSLKFACGLLSIATPLDLLKAINYQL